MTRSQWEEMCEVVEDVDGFIVYAHENCLEPIDIFYLGYDFCMADKIYKED